MNVFSLHIQVTDTLHKLATFRYGSELALSPSTLLSSARHFLNFTRKASHDFKDEMDVVYFARSVGNYLPYLPVGTGAGEDLGHYLMSMIENVLPVSPSLLGQAQLRDRACQRLIQVINNVTLVLPGFQHHTNKYCILFKLFNS